MNQPKLETVPINDLRPNPWNSNKVSPENAEKIRRSIVKNGLFKPIIVREVAGVEGFEILGGQHRWEQAIELGYEDIPISNVGAISDAKAKEIGVIDNARYGIDDTLELADILKEIGSTEDIQDVLPYGDLDLASIFSSSDIDLDSLDVSEDFSEDEEPEGEERPMPKAAKTHTVQRFKVSLEDAEWIATLIAKVQKDHDFTDEDQLTNAGDALVYLLGDKRPKSPKIELEEVEDELDEAIKELNDD